MIAGIGCDVVNVADFAQQMHDSNGWRSLFSTRELRQCAMRAHLKNDAEAIHIAARWAGKEAVIKAWCEALSSLGLQYPYTLDNTPWASIEILDDSHGCPSVRLSEDVNQKLLESLHTPEATNPHESASVNGVNGINDVNRADRPNWHMSLSHDGLVQNSSAVALAFVVLELCES
ncbi:4'-phosphopantetheinyl transferase superfamily protein [Gardnerella vaginalis]|uniref:4'-phosphopantetheinyl transferase superfamily protein n=1 Tax=Gardnerella vaginalis TaxID=2702 RepID=A0ABD4ZF07_GARVA|nr:4'-phosphopantetheinyl transferase superfamily protein [Gardnerella vaginalis]MDK6861477.1 4'-phosphopantetheinyl transferase superfamily protein [Gardnerella vaginalis]